MHPIDVDEVERRHVRVREAEQLQLQEPHAVRIEFLVVGNPLLPEAVLLGEVEYEVRIANLGRDTLASGRGIEGLLDLRRRQPVVEDVQSSQAWLGGGGPDDFHSSLLSIFSIKETKGPSFVVPGDS